MHSESTKNVVPACRAHRADGVLISSNRTLYLPQSPANSRHSLVKVPFFGLPKILEQTINNILEESKLVSYKIAGNGPRATIVLRFDANMADASVSPIH